MGVALAAAAARRHAHVTLVAGPLEVGVPRTVERVDVESTSGMRDAVASELPTADVLIMAAAPADFTAATPASRKLKKQEAPETIALTRTDDILLSTRSARKEGCIVVGFALETGDAANEAQRKLQDKALDLVVANDATAPGAGFGVTTNRVTLVHRSGEIEPLALMSKRDVADAILDRVEVLLDGR